MRTILHFIPTLGAGGAERQLSLLSMEQARRGVTVHVACRRGGAFEESLRQRDIRISILGDYKGINPALYLKCHALVREVRPDVVQTWLPQMDIAAGMAAISNSVPWILTERSMRYAYEQRRFSAWLRCLLARRAQAVVTNSLGGAAYWRQSLGIRAPITKIGNAVDVDGIRSAISTDDGESGDREPHVLVVGRLSPEKAPDVVVEAVKLTRGAHAIRVSIIGDGPMRHEIEKMIKDRGLSDCCSLYPFQLHWWQLLRSASTLVSVSRYEGHPNVVLEALAAGCPLIVSDISAHREFLDETSAIFVPPDDPVALSKAIISAVSDRESAQLRAARASNIVDKLRVDFATDAYEKVYAHALRQVAT